MKRYDSYKDSGVQWLGEIPGHWGKYTLRRFLRLVSVKNHPNSQLLSVTREQGVIIRDTESKEENHNFIPEDLSGYKYVEVGDFCINKMKSWQGSYAVSAFEGIVSPAYYICKLNGVYKPFFSTAIRSKAYIPFFAQYSKGIRIGQWDLSPVGLMSIPFFLPDVKEQQAIVSYLDDKCGKIDKLLEGKQKQIDLLAETKQKVIADAVTKGLDPNVRMKSTNIPWLPEIPEHWELRRLKSLFNQRSESYKPGEQLQVLSLLKDVGVIPYSEKGNIGNKAKEDYSSYNVARKGDIVMNSMNVIIGSVDITKFDGYISPAYYALYSKDGVSTEFYNYIFHLRACQKHMRSLANGILEIRLRISTTNLFGMFYPVPPLSEQNAIVSNINERVSKIDTLASKLQQEIDAIKEYKQRLISDVVTGQIKVC